MSAPPIPNEYPEEDFGIIEIDVDRYLTEEQRSWPVVKMESAAEDFAIEEPLPALDVRAADARLAGLVAVLSDQEATLGGGGLEVARTAPDAGRVRATLLPRRVEGARGRFERLAAWAAAFGSEVAVTVV